MNHDELRELTWQSLNKFTIGPRYFKDMMEGAEALWLHDNDPKKPHVELHAGDHSNGFEDALRLLRFANICFALAGELATQIRGAYVGSIDWVIGSDHAGATFSQNVAIHLGAARLH